MKPELTVIDPLVVAQTDIEYMHSKDKIHAEIMADIENSPELMALVDQCIPLIMEYMQQDCMYTVKSGERRFWASKAKRLSHLMSIDLETIVMYLMSVILPLGTGSTLTSIAGQIAKAFKYPELEDGVQTAGELIAVLKDVGIYSLVPPRKSHSDMWELIPNYVSDKKVLQYIEQTYKLPPMICKPNRLKHNMDSAYLTVTGDCLVTGKEKKPYLYRIALDHLNIMNSVELSLDMKILQTIDEIEPDAIKDEKKKKQLTDMVRKSYAVYKHLFQAGNKFYLAHKYDTRGRTYADGYHVTSQGNSFKKAILNLHHKELIET